MNLDIFAHAARQNSPPGCYNQPPDKGKLLRFFENLFSPSRMGGGGGGGRERKLYNIWVLCLIPENRGRK